MMLFSQPMHSAPWRRSGSVTSGRRPLRFGTFRGLHNRVHLWSVITVATWVVTAWFSAPSKAQEVDDFDGVALGQHWTVIGNASSARRIAVPDDVAHPGVDGHLVQAELEAGGRLVTRTEFPLPPLPAAVGIRFRIRALEATADQPQTLECQGFSGERSVWRWCRFELNDNQWHTVELPLRFFRHAGGAYVAWDEVTRIGWMARQRGTYQIDQVELIPGDQPGASELQPDELQALAFPGRGEIHRGEHFVIITDVEGLDAEAVLNALENLEQRVRHDLPGLPALTSPVPLLIFATHDAYQDFFKKLAKPLRADVQPPTTPGYTVFGIACAVYSDEFGAVRPIYVHEACHALLARLLGLGNQGEWLHEGAASHFQTLLLEQDRVAPARYVLAEPVPWSELLCGEPIKLAQYAHAMFVLEWLLAEPRRREAFLAELAEIRQRRSTRIDHRLPQLLDADETTLQADFRRFVQQVGRDANPVPPGAEPKSRPPRR